MNIINTVSTSRFSLNGVEYLKNYISRVAGNRVEIFNCYDSTDVLVELVLYSEFTVNGVAYDNAAQLQAALLSVIYSRNTLGSGADINQNNTGKEFLLFFSGVSELTIEEIILRVNNFSPLAISETQTPVFVECYKMSTSGLAKYLYVFKGGKGVWGTGGTPVTASQFRLIGSPVPATNSDVDNGSNTQTISLGELPDGDYITAANAEEHDFSDEEIVYFFSYISGGVEYRVIFNGAPGVYGGEGNPQFDNTNLVPGTNSTVQPITGLPEVTAVNNATTDNLVVFDAIAGEKTAHTAKGTKYTDSSGNVVNTEYEPPIAPEVTYTVPAKPHNDIHAMRSDLIGTPIEMFGAVGDGLIDNAEAIQAAVDSEYNYITIGQGLEDVYIISKPINVPSYKTVEIHGTVKIQDGHQDLLLADVAIGATSVTVSGASTKYYPGQQVCISGTNRAIQGGGTGQTRRTASAMTILSVAGNTITFTEPLDYAYTTAQAATIGHCQSVFIVQDSVNVVFRGKGIVDQNKANQYDIEPVTVSGTIAEAVKFGCAITLNDSENINVEGITAQNSVLHNLHAKYVDHLTVDDFTTLDAHDKNILLWFCNNFHITNVTTIGAVYEDGLILHNENHNGFIDNIYMKNCNRAGLFLSTATSNVIVGKAISEDCGRAMWVQLSDNIEVKSFTASGGGRTSDLISRNMFEISKVTNSQFNLVAQNSVYTTAGVAVLGVCSNIVIEANVFGLIGSSSNGRGLVLGVASGQAPSDVVITNSHLQNNKNGLYVDALCSNIKMINGVVSGNTTNVTNNAGVQFKPFNVKGITANAIDGTLAITDGTANNHAVSKSQLDNSTTFGNVLAAGSNPGWASGQITLTSYPVGGTLPATGTPSEAAYRFDNIRIKNYNHSSSTNDMNEVFIYGGNIGLYRWNNGSIIGGSNLQPHPTRSFHPNLFFPSMGETLASEEYVDDAISEAISGAGGTTEYSGTYSETPVWTPPANAPTSLTNATYRATKTGKHVEGHILLFYGTAGTSLTRCDLPLPSGLPAPADIPGADALNNIPYSVDGFMATGASVGKTGGGASGGLQKTATGYQIVLVQSGNFRLVSVKFEYWTA